MAIAGWIPKEIDLLLPFYLVNGEEKTRDLDDLPDNVSDFQHAMRSAKGFSDVNKKKTTRLNRNDRGT